MREPVAGTTPAGPYVPGMLTEGRLLYVSGQGPTVDGAYEPADVAVETERVIDNLERILAGAGCTLADVVRCGVYLVDMGAFAAMNEVYARRFPEPRPARTTIGVAALPLGIQVEIDCIARVP